MWCPLVSYRRVLLLSAVLLVACAGQKPGSSVVPAGVVTVPDLLAMARQGVPLVTMYAAVERSGTVYRLTPEQSQRMRAAGVPPSLVGDLELTYEHAIRTNPALEVSDAYWHLVDGFWYGGVPYGWPREWVVAPTPLGVPLHRSPKELRGGPGNP